MSNAIQIYLRETNLSLKNQIKESLAAAEFRYEIHEATLAEIQSLPVTDASFSLLIFSEENIPAEDWPGLVTTGDLQLICLQDPNNEQTDNEKFIANGIRFISKNPDEISKLPAIIEEIAANRNQKIFLEYLFSEKKSGDIGKLLSGFAHNISAPLTGILGYAEILRSAHPELTEIDNIISQARRVDSIIRTLVLKNIQMDDKAKDMIELNELIKNEIQFLQANMVFKHEIKKKFDFAEKIPKFTAKYNDVSQIVCTFLTWCTAMTRNSSSKNLTVSTGSDETTVHLEFKYRGLPLPRAEIFQCIRQGQFYEFINGTAGLAHWLPLNFDICLACYKLADLQAVLETSQTSPDGQTIIIKFPRNRR